jgi:arabinose-5-phosphate isomerase
MFTPNSKKIKVKDVMLPLNHFPVLQRKELLKEALELMGKFSLGIVTIVDEESKLLGIVTDGDIRRKLLRIQKPFSAFFVDDALVHAIKKPLTIGPDEELITAVKLMEEKKVWDLPVVDEKNRLFGLLHLHPAVCALLGIDK